MASSLDLGSGPFPKNPFGASDVFGVDIRKLGGNIRCANLVIEPIPFEDNSFDYVTAYDFIEHIPRVIALYDNSLGTNYVINPFVKLMNEIWRVLKHDGIFFSRTPAFPHPEAFQDPTHVNIITTDTFPLYFNDHYPVANIYGFTGAFQIINQLWDSFHLVTTLKKSPRPDLSKFKPY
jgi:SAM-dependent methyltransferase